MPFAVRDNLTMASMNRFSVQGVLQPERGTALAKEMVESLAIKTPGLGVPTGTLSGGNQRRWSSATG